MKEKLREEKKYLLNAILYKKLHQEDILDKAEQRRRKTQVSPGKNGQK